MAPNVIVMITLLAMPNGESSMQLRPFETVAACAEAAKIEATDPFVVRVACSELTDGAITISFKRPPKKHGLRPRGRTAG